MSLPEFGCWRVNGWTIRIAPGRKGEGDRRIYVASPGGEPSLLSLASLGAIAALWCCNEDLLYPPSEGLKGGEKVLEFIRECWESNLRDACVVHRLNQPNVERLA